VSLVEIRALNRIVSGWCAIAPGMLADGDERPSETNGVGVCSQFVPYELIGIISPWNFPFLLSMLDAIPALIAGCSVIVKPSEVTPRFIKPLIRSLAAFPELAGVFRWVEGDGETGAAIIDTVDAIAFTGSVATGRIVAEGCAGNFIPAFLELGGKDPAIVLPTADLEKAARIILRASVQATGQACQSLERIYVPEEHYAAFVDVLVAMAEKVELNYPDVHQGQIGPLIFARQAEIITSHMEDAVQKGAKIRCGGIIESYGGGTWIRPTVLTGVDHSMLVMTEETFGPVIPVMPYKDIDTAIRLANDTRYGLSAAVIGPDVDEAIAVGRQINVGAVSINDGGLTTDVHDATHDSFRLSGMGASRMGISGLMRFMRQKAILIRHTEALGIESLPERQPAT
jgi:aldehyde dehydrogenase (NAD+)